jgi:ribosomal protein L40E
MSDDPNRNHGWVRPPGWKFEEDWGSPAWNERMRRSDEALAKEREKYGFVACPKCSAVHTTQTTFCRECRYRVMTPSRFASWLKESDAEIGFDRFKRESWEPPVETQYLTYATHCVDNVDQSEWPGCILDRLEAKLAET